MNDRSKFGSIERRLQRRECPCYKLSAESYQLCDLLYIGSRAPSTISGNRKQCNKNALFVLIYARYRNAVQKWCSVLGARLTLSNLVVGYSYTFSVRSRTGYEGRFFSSRCPALGN